MGTLAPGKTIAPASVPALLLALGVVACPGGDQVEARMSGEQQAARASIVDEEQGFALSAPGPGWELLGPEDAGEVSPGARAAARGPDGCFGAVHVGPIPAEPLEAYVWRRAETWPVAERVVEWVDLIRYCEKPARRFGVRGREGAGPVRYQVTIMAAEGRLYEVRAWNASEIFTIARRCFDAFTASFELR